MAKVNSTIEKIFLNNRHICKHYAKKVFNYERYGYEFQDLVQEFEEKLYTSIITYGEKLIEYKQTGKYKPVPIEFYLKSAMLNKVKDYIKKFNLPCVENTFRISVDENFDIGTFSTLENEVDYNKDEFIINGVDLTMGLMGNQRRCFCLWLKGFETKKIQKVFKNIAVNEIIENQTKTLRNHKNELMDYYNQRYVVQTFEEE